MNAKLGEAMEKSMKLIAVAFMRSSLTTMGRRFPRLLAFNKLVWMSTVHAAEWEIAKHVDPNKVVGH